MEDLESRVSDLEAEVNSLRVNVHGPNQLWHLVRDHEQRFDTLQTPWFKRIYFWVQGWPWYNLNGTKKHRPWDGDK